jgi:hypothetical protein
MWANGRFFVDILITMGAFPMLLHRIYCPDDKEKSENAKYAFHKYYLLVD